LHRQLSLQKICLYIRKGKRMTNDGSNSIRAHPVVSHEEWLSARTAFLAKEKEFTRQRDELSRQRRELAVGEG